jgi:hypothetical protein
LSAEFEKYPRPDAEYFEFRHEWLTQGDIFADVPISQLGPELLGLDPAPELSEPIPEGLLPVVTLVWTTGAGMLLSNTCDFRHPRARDIDDRPLDYPDPDDVYHNGFIRVAPIFPLADCPFIPDDAGVRERIARFDHFRRFLYLPAMTASNAEGGEIIVAESVVALQMADLLHIDLIRSLPKLAQLTRSARQQLNRKLVLLDTGAQSLMSDFNPDMD